MTILIAVFAVVALAAIGALVLRRSLVGEFRRVAEDGAVASASQAVDRLLAANEADRQLAAEKSDRSRDAVEHLVDPIAESLAKVDARLEQLEVSRQQAYVGLTEQVRALSETQELLRGETSNLVTALRNPTARGRWGEIQLRRVVEMAGMLAHCDFESQVTVATEDGAIRPDVIVRLPGTKQVVVDSKVPLDAYLEAVEATDDGDCNAKLVRHARQVRSHVDKLSAKSYWAQFADAPDFVVMFVPGDALLSAALEHDPALMEHAVANKVLLATPVTLIALLRAVAYGWQQEALAENARQIAEVGQEMQVRVQTFATHFAKVGKNLDRAVDAYNDAVGSLEHRVLAQARKFTELEVSDHELPAPAGIVKRTRSLVGIVRDEDGEEPFALEA